MGRKSLKEIRQREIVKVFYKVAKKEGLENTSIAKIAKVMDINPSLIIHYFQTKEELTYALIDYILEKYLLIYKISRDNNVPLHEALVTVIDDLFSKKWNKLFDDGLFYSCYALAFREDKVKTMYKNLTDSLREKLTVLIQRCQQENELDVPNPRRTADLIFALVDGAYFYLSLADNNKEFDLKIADYKMEAYRLLGIRDASLFPQTT
ncbi:TetR family transcriptional regulator [Parapedobacter koreensis]|uniref:Biofilm operon icaADBC HTH-type negative transcriptional regulator IcaR n=1 Tax=Parapedobacter koreensis TaxID=332977 RepID=A0A1H7EW85_9SPHI|nr:TetR family transcriptional regulator [Parapedobacter koreensis]SEK18121.1 transcriptional regulator, TetR family [Parapedobacter koreensis]